jgi:hypothetical protein
LTPTMDPVDATKIISLLNLNDPPIPLPAAASQLHAAVSQAITFFDSFYRSFRTSMSQVKTFGDKDLLNKIWATQIRASQTEPSKDWSHPNDQNQQQQQQQQQQYQGRNHHNNNQGESLSFPQHQKRILERNDAVLRAQCSSVPQAAAEAGVSSWPDRELQQQQQRHRAAEALKRKVRNGTEDLRYTLQAMTVDYEMAKMAIRELKFLRQNLTTYRACWRPDWELEDDDGNDSDDEAQGDQYQQ